MAAFQIIRIPRTDTSEEEGAYILGQVTPSSSSAGSKLLNLRFVATEGEEPYVVKLRHDRIGELKVSNSPCSPDEWEAILKSVLLNIKPDGDGIDGIEAGAEAHVGKTVTITIRRRVAGINQRLGTITLNHKPDEGIQLFDWCGAAALGRQKAEEAAADETAKVAILESRATELKNQIEELLESKKARETEILQKVCALLNEKKVKIRKQQRLLSMANVNPYALAGAAASQATSPASQSVVGRIPKASRAGKRKAGGKDVADGDGSMSDDSEQFEKMDVDVKDEQATQPPPPPKEVDSDDRETSDDDDDDDATGSGPDDEDEPLPPPKPEPIKAAKGRPPKGGAAAKGKETLTMHPKRSTRTTRATASPPPPQPVDGSETESDDEL
ncbi:hypothetical protein B0H63DRAFT_146599 [Podospora didyma]|uniref:Mitotic apparatus protein p62 n=1 Tax=Podospora didyma TaxID=330526 RepID=A0AAE0U103_9PEZI|nr:hypothetical protein B0H63DRAFT_146599 [Podospora didyma]